MSDDDSTPADPIRQQFPNLKPLKAAPALFRINGCGIGMYGKRDPDPETGTYVKTRSICAVFVPLFALGAYRVADVESGGWYFLGKESLSGFARSWNVVVVFLLLCAGLAVGWESYTSSPEYRAQLELTRAAELLAAGEPARAAGVYRQQLRGPAAGEARTGLRKSIDLCLEGDNPQAAAAALRLVADLPEAVNQPEPMAPEAFQRGLLLVAKFRSADLDGAIDVLEATAALDGDNEALLPLKVELLRESVAATPDNLNRVVDLALIYESNEQPGESVTLLSPYQDKLGDTEGARILGQHLLREGRNEDAYGLLFPYVATRLEKMRALESDYTNTLAMVSKRTLDDLNKGQASSAWYRNYEKASETEREIMVENYLQDRMKTDPGYQRVLAQLMEANQIVPVTLDLGIVQLNRAQNLKDAAARKAELEAAEKTFLAIKGFAGETDEYRLFLGQVYFWLGKSKEGSELFEELLASNQRAYPFLISLSQTLRAVGEQGKARALAEEAYAAAGSPKDKFAAALLRSLLFTDTDDQIAWLEKADSQDGNIQIELNSARGKKALQDGNKTLASEFLRKAIRGYDKQPKSSSSLNNCGLACFDLYEATGNLADHQRGLALLEEAILLEPGNSILLHNTMYFLLTQAVMDVVQDSIHVEALGMQPGLHMLSYLHGNDEERAAIYRQLQDSETMKRTLACMDQVLLLAPKNVGNYSTALALHSGFRDLKAVQMLKQRFEVAAPDLTETRERMLEACQGANDEEELEKVRTQIRIHEGLLAAPAVAQHELTLEYVMISLLGLRQNAWVYGGPLDGGELLSTAQEVDRRHRSLASRHMLKSAHYFRAHEELSGQSPAYASLAARTRRTLAPQLFIDFILEQGGTLADLACKNEHVLAALALEREGVEDYPFWPAPTQWAALRHSSPEVAALVQKRLRENELTRLSNELEFEFNPWSGSAVIEQYWTHKMMGNEERAVQIYTTALDQGLPLPPL